MGGLSEGWAICAQVPRAELFLVKEACSVRTISYLQFQARGRIAAVLAVSTQVPTRYFPTNPVRNTSRHADHAAAAVPPGAVSSAVGRLALWARSQRCCSWLCSWGGGPPCGCHDESMGARK